MLERCLMTCLALGLGIAPELSAARSSALRELPNVVLIFADDLGYGDLGCYGGTRGRTPHLDRLAREGMRWTSFYVAQPVCSASRAALLTGCYPHRLGIHGALGPDARHGIADGETTLGELVKTRGYATAAIGKWHLGHHPQFLPTRHGFDEYFGLPYSNDMWPRHPEARAGTYPDLPLIEGERVVETDPDQSRLTQRYTERAVAFIERNRDRPFFLYVAHSMPHVPLFASAKFRGRSDAGLYGDVIEEIDASVGTIVRTLRKHRLERDTLVIFTSDNGPWLSYGSHAGSSGGLREGKGTVWEGGVRVPFIARWPGRIPAGRVCEDPGMTIDLLPTIARLTGAALPPLRIDGRDLWPLLAGEPGARSPQDAYFFYYEMGELQAVRSGRWKLHLPHRSRTLGGRAGGLDGRPARYTMEDVPLSLFDLVSDPWERTNRVAELPDVTAQLQQHAEAARQELGDRLTQRTGTGVRAPGRLP